jgi:hypothetical protein
VSGVCGVVTILWFYDPKCSYLRHFHREIDLYETYLGEKGDLDHNIPGHERLGLEHS